MSHQNTEDTDTLIDNDNFQNATLHSLNSLPNPSAHFSPPPLPLYINSDSPTYISEENVNSNLNFNRYGPHTSPGVSPPTVDADRALGIFTSPQVVDVLCCISKMFVCCEELFNVLLSTACLRVCVYSSHSAICCILFYCVFLEEMQSIGILFATCSNVFCLYRHLL